MRLPLTVSEGTKKVSFCVCFEYRKLAAEGYQQFLEVRSTKAVVEVGSMSDSSRGGWWSVWPNMDGQAVESFAIRQNLR